MANAVVIRPRREAFALRAFAGGLALLVAVASTLAPSFQVWWIVPTIPLLQVAIWGPTVLDRLWNRQPDELASSHRRWIRVDTATLLVLFAPGLVVALIV